MGHTFLTAQVGAESKALTLSSRTWHTCIRRMDRRHDEMAASDAPIPTLPHHPEQSWL